jgi:hypothetical protein
MGTEPLPPGVYPIAVDKYIISYKSINSWWPNLSDISDLTVSRWLMTTVVCDQSDRLHFDDRELYTKHAVSTSKATCF